MGSGIKLSDLGGVVSKVLSCKGTLVYASTINEMRISYMICSLFLDLKYLNGLPLPLVLNISYKLE